MKTGAYNHTAAQQLTPFLESAIFLHIQELNTLDHKIFPNQTHQKASPSPAYFLSFTLFMLLEGLPQPVLDTYHHDLYSSFHTPHHSQKIELVHIPLRHKFLLVKVLC